MPAPSLRLLTAFAVSLCLPAAAWAVPKKGVTRELIKVGVDKVMSVSLAATQPAGDKQRTVVVRMASTYPGCADLEPFHFAEGELDKVKYISFWAPTKDPCPGGGAVDLEYPLTLEVGKTHAFVFRGPKRFDQRVSFRLEKDKVSSLLMKKVIAH